MSFEIYIKNIKNLSQSLGLKKAVELDENLSVSFIYSCEGQSLIVNIGYDIYLNQVQIDTLISNNMPSSRLGIQTIMNQLVGDLLTQDRNIGKLIAAPEDFAVKLVKIWDLDSFEEHSLALFIPIFASEAVKWRKKFKQSLLKNNRQPTSRPQEIISFESM